MMQSKMTDFMITLSFVKAVAFSFYLIVHVSPPTLETDKGGTVPEPLH